MTTIETIWQQLEATLNTNALIYRRYPEVKPDIYAGLRSQGICRERLLALAFTDPIPSLPATVSYFQDIRVEWVNDPLNGTRRLLLLTLRNPALSDLFAVVCEDLIVEIAGTSSQQLLISQLFDRLSRWRALFESYSADGLSAEAQRGLFGELYFLRTLLLAGINPVRTLTGWVGPTKASQDFAFAEVAIEVKTSVAVNPQSFQVSNTRQLDDTGLASLFVLFLSLNSFPEQGETLNQLADDIANQLEPNSLLVNQFRLRLFEAGYFPTHRIRYDQPGYLIRVETIFRVGDGFPRLREMDIPPGINEVRYSVSLAACAPFTASQQDIFHQLTL